MWIQQQRQQSTAIQQVLQNTARKMSVLYYLKESPEWLASKSQIVAQYTGTKIQMKVFDPAKPEYLEHNPFKKVPYLVEPQGVVVYSSVIAKHIARTRPDIELNGATFSEQLANNSWVEFVRDRIEVPGAVLVWAMEKKLTVSDAIVQKAYGEISAALAEVEKRLASGAYLVSSSTVCVADICCVAVLAPLMTKVFDTPELTKQFPKVVEYYSRCVKIPQFASVLKGADKLCKQSPFKNMKFQPAPRVAPPAENKKPAAAPSSQPKSKAAPAPAPKAAPAAAPAAGGGGSAEDMAALEAQKAKVMDLKKAKADKAEIDAAVAELLRLKALCGEEVPSKQDKKKKK